MVKATASISSAKSSTPSSAKASAKASRPKAQPQQHTDSETRSQHILGPVSFELSALSIAGTANEIPAPYPGQTPSIIAADELFLASLDIRFNKSPLSALLMCLGTQITVNFHFEGQGRRASELDVEATIVTEKDEFFYEIELEGMPSDLGMEPGLYKVSATIEVGPTQHECSQFVLGYGYISEVLLQVYPAI